MVDTTFAKRVLLINGAVPLALLCWDASQHQLGANPTNFALHTTGMMALIFLTLSLAVTPLRKINGLSWLIALRRTLGVYAFFYAAIHFLLYYGFDRSWRVLDTLSEIAKRPYLLIGTIALLTMAPLAATSTNGMIKRLGGKRWQKLHRLAYVAGIAGVIHYYMQSKAVSPLAIAFAVTLGILLAYRLNAFIQKQQSKPARTAKA